MHILRHSLSPLGTHIAKREWRPQRNTRGVIRFVFLFREEGQLPHAVKREFYHGPGV